MYMAMYVRTAANRMASAAAALCLASGAAAPVAAQDAPWEFLMSPYLWASGTKAKVSPPGTAGSHQVDVKFKDIIKNLDGVPIIGAGEIRKGRFGVLTDVMYLPIATRIDTRNVLFNDGKSEMSTLMVAMAAFYRVADDTAIKADVGAGFRLWSISSKTTLNPGLLPGLSVKVSETFVDPILAVRANLALSDRWSVTGYFDIGGFDLGKTELTWQLMGTVNYRAADWVDLRMGWRHLAVERKKITVDLTGPIVGATFRFGASGPAVAPPPPAPTTTQYIVFFDFDRANLTAQALTTIRQAAAAAKAGNKTRIGVTGHADRSGGDVYNMALSLRRANAVKDQLVREGIPAAGITVVGRGESQPLVPTADGVREPQNRRVEIVLQ
jgi:outer membrane protein OmpA-like peptidoglycan-associated protein